MSVDDEDKGQRDAYWRAREKADAERDDAPDVISGGVDEPDDEPEKSPFVTAFEKAALGRAPSDYEQPDEPDDGYAPYSPSAPAPSSPALSAAQQRGIETQESAKQTGRAAKYDSALADVRRIAAEPTPGVDIDAIQAGQRSRNQKTAANDFTRAIQAMLLRKPFEPSAPTDAEDALTVQSLKAKQGQADKASRLSAAEMVARALRGEKQPGMTAYQSAELERQKTLDAQKSSDRATALSDRKRTMLSLYPEHKADIEALTDLGDAQTLQTALEGRLGRNDTQAHSDEAARAAQAHSDEMQRRSEAFSKHMKEWELSHRPLTAEQATQLEGIEKSDAAIDTFEKSLSGVSSTAAKVGAQTGKLGGAIGLPGSEFQSAREGTAIALARGLEGGMARPGNVEIIQHMLPEASDADDVKRKKMATIREFIANNRDSFKRALEQGGTAPLRPVAPKERPPPPAEAPPPGLIPPNAVNVKKLKSGKWYYEYPDGTPETVSAGGG